MTQYRWFVTATVVTCGLFGVGLVQLSAQQTAGGSPANDIVDRFQRTYEVLGNNEVATSGVARGETIYFYKCWMCHQEAAGKGDKSGLVGPALKDVFKHLMTDDAVAAKIKNGGPRMPAFGTTFTNADVADLVSYLRSPTCCYENQEPPKSPHYQAETHRWPVSSALKGGARGVVRMVNGQPLEGIKVQLIAPNAVRTTVFTDADGRYEFPTLQAGPYTLRIATPAPYKAYVRDGVEIKGALKLDDIVVERIPSPEPSILSGSLQATPEVLAQMSGAEWLWNLPGTAEQKATFAKSCAIGCHSYELILRNRYDERSWRLIVERMKTGAQGGAGRAFDPESEAGTTVKGEIEAVAKWLALVRGPDSKDPPVRLFPSRPRGAATRVVITEFEPNRRLLNLHDVCGDANGNIWYTSHHSPYVGYLDPRTGIVKEFKLPPVEGRPTIDNHACRVDTKNGVAWFSQGPPQTPGPYSLFRVNMETGEVKTFPRTAITINFGLAPDGSLWGDRTAAGGVHEIVQVDPQTGNVLKAYPRTTPFSYQTSVSDDGRFVAGSSPVGVGGNTTWMLDVAKGKLYENIRSDVDHGAARGGFDPYGNAWFGGHDGPLVEVVNEIDKGKGIYTKLFYPPTPPFPYSDFYTATVDKNGEVWGGLLHGRGFVRFNPKTERWIVYENPEPSALNRYQWIDNSTSPPTIWYADFLTQMIVRIQPME
jgi:mono/diheme cytochrome c family protein